MVVVAGGAVVVPQVSVERTAPVGGEIGLPEADDLRAAPAGTTPRRTMPAPEVSCTRGEVELDCLAWSRALLPPPDEDGRFGWVIAAGAYLLGPTPGALEAADLATGTRLWRLDLEENLGPLAVDGDVAVLAGPDESMVVELATGTVRWHADTRPGVHGDVLGDGLVLTGQLPVTDGPLLVARDVVDGHTVWTWGSGNSAQVHRRPGGEVLVASDQGLAVLDAATGQERLRTDTRSDWIVDVVDDVAVVVAARHGDPAGHDPADEPGTTLLGVDLTNGSIRWERDVDTSRINPGTAGGLLLMSSPQHLTAIDAATGEVAWQQALEPGQTVAHHRFPMSAQRADAVAPPQVVVILDTADDVVRGHDPGTGSVVWEHAVATNLQHASVGADTVVVHDTTGYLLLDLPTGRERLHVRAPGVPLASLDPLVLLHPASGHVLRVEPPDASADL